jgi:hypothetical protein
MPRESHRLPRLAALKLVALGSFKRLVALAVYFAVSAKRPWQMLMHHFHCALAPRVLGYVVARIVRALWHGECLDRTQSATS